MENIKQKLSQENTYRIMVIAMAVCTVIAVADFILLFVDIFAESAESASNYDTIYEEKGFFETLIDHRYSLLYAISELGIIAVLVAALDKGKSKKLIWIAFIVNFFIRLFFGGSFDVTSVIFVVIALLVQYAKNPSVKNTAEKCWIVPPIIAAISVIRWLMFLREDILEAHFYMDTFINFIETVSWFIGVTLLASRIKAEHTSEDFEKLNSKRKIQEPIMQAENAGGQNKMKYCSHCGKEILDAAVICPNCGCPVGNGVISNEADEPSVGLNVLGFLIPIVGLILFLVYNDKAPRKAKSIGKFSLIGFCIGLVFYFLVLIWFLDEGVLLF